MPDGTPIPRDLIFVLRGGETVVDWGNGRVQDVESGRFYEFEERDFGRAVTDRDLDRLTNVGRVVSYDSRIVYLRPLPEPPRRTID